MTTITATQPRTAARPTGFTSTLASEWAKLFSLRSTYIMLTLGLVLSIGMTALVSMGVASSFDGWDASDQAAFDPLEYAWVGIIFGSIVYAVFGVLAVSGEYGSGMIRQTFIATPRRGRVLAAKALIVAAVLVVLSLIMTVSMFLVAQAIFSSYDLPAASLSNRGAQRMVLGFGLLGPLFPLIGLALGFILRSTAGAITAVLAILWLPQMFGGLLPTWWSEHILSLLPGSAWFSVAIGHIEDSSMYVDPVRGAGIAAAWLVIFLGAAYVSLARRDA